jgi:hypothetical protein
MIVNHQSWQLGKPAWQAVIILPQPTQRDKTRVRQLYWIMYHPNSCWQQVSVFFSLPCNWAWEKSARFYGPSDKARPHWSPLFFSTKKNLMQVPEPLYIQHNGEDPDAAPAACLWYGPFWRLIRPRWLRGTAARQTEWLCACMHMSVNTLYTHIHIFLSFLSRWHTHTSTRPMRLATMTRLALVCVDLNSKSEARVEGARSGVLCVTRSCDFIHHIQIHTHKHTNHPRCQSASECWARATP